MESLENTISVEDSKEIKAIGQDTVHKICSGQVVLSLSIAMKELLENAIDAGANIIDIHLNEYGSELLEVSDNGAGIHKNNFQALTLKHHTSKIQEFSDLETLETLGFRGEALSSLCALSDVEIVTKHQSSDVARKLQYDNNGKIVNEITTARQQGTTVTLKKLFTTLPVRRKEFIKNLKKEFNKLCNLLYAYCLIPNSIKYTCINTTNKGTKNIVVKTEGHTTVRETIISIFGVKQLASLIEVDIVTPGKEIINEYGITLEEELPFNFEFLISSVVHGSGRSSTDRQFYYINLRPCDLTKLTKLVNETYKQFNTKQYPFVYLNISTKTSLVDVNITPDKRQVFLEKEQFLLAIIKASLLEAFKHFPSTYKIQGLDISKNLHNSSTESRRGIKRSVTEGNMKPMSILEMFKKRSKSDETNRNTSRTNFSNFGLENTNNKYETEHTFKLSVDVACKLKNGNDTMENIVDIEDDEYKENSLDKSNMDVTVIDSPETNNDKNETHLKVVSLELIKKRFANLNNTTTSEESIYVRFRSLLDPVNNKTAEDELNRHISKDDFKNMDIVGQFNLGFIITKLNDDMFIIDQHATDEKYNFEQLQMNTVIESQALVSPKLLELTSAGRSILTEHNDIFKKNGFSFNIESSDPTKIYLTSIPISEKTVFGKSDIEEMIFMLQEDSIQSTMCRPSRITSMFASRACRKSVMIGKSLSMADMRRLINHMGEIDQPWSCPHGRPTMRHLVSLNLIV